MNDFQLIPTKNGRHTDASLNAVNSYGPIRIDIPPSGQQREYFGLHDYWVTIRRYRKGIALATACGALIGFLLTLSDARIYQARTTLEIQGVNGDFLNMKNVNPISDSGNSYYDNDIQTQVKILQSRMLIAGVREKLLHDGKMPENLQPPNRWGAWRKVLKLNPPTSRELWMQALGIAADTVGVRSSGTNRIVEVSCDSTSAQVAADFCNTLSQVYIDENLEARWKATERTGQWLTKQLQDLKIKLERQESDLQSYASATRLVIAGDKGDVQEIKLADLQKELSAAQADRISKQSKFEMASTSPPGALPDVLDDASLKEAQKALADLQVRLAQLRVTFTPNHAEVKRVEAQITVLEQSLQAARNNILTRVSKDYDAAKRREALLASAYDSQTSVVSGQAEQTAHYGLLKRDVDSTRALYESLLQRLKEASIASAMRASNVRIVDTAEPPATPYKPAVLRTCGIGLLFGLACGIALAVVRQKADRTLQDPGDIQDLLGMPELGVVPLAGRPAIDNVFNLPLRLPAPPHAKGGHDRVGMISRLPSASMIAESFRTILTSIVFSRRNGEQPRVLVLTSGSPEEGKTTIVTNLGICLAQLNHTVLLIDADMRRPRLHTLFELENDMGLSDLLLGEGPLDVKKAEAACMVTTVRGLHVLPAGSRTERASSLMHSARLAAVLQFARQNFDMVVVDTPPMLTISDARIVARLSDGVILVVRSGVTTRDAASFAAGRFAEDSAPVLGTILNFWNPKMAGHSYYDKSYTKYHEYYSNDDTGEGSTMWKQSLGLRPPPPEAHAPQENRS
jgi:succinoglycan biosynthesis transport protein ExoP